MPILETLSGEDLIHIQQYFAEYDDGKDISIKAMQAEVVIALINRSTRSVINAR